MRPEAGKPVQCHTQQRLLAALSLTTLSPTSVLDYTPTHTHHWPQHPLNVHIGAQLPPHISGYGHYIGVNLGVPALQPSQKLVVCYGIEFCKEVFNHAQLRGPQAQPPATLSGNHSIAIQMLDIQHHLPPFLGTNLFSIERWINDFSWFIFDILLENMKPLHLYFLASGWIKD